MKKLTQKKTILIWLKEHESITARQAFELFDCLRLAPCIYELRKQGYAIITERVGRSRYARYCLKEHKGVTDE
jgi:hypothetical protein